MRNGIKKELALIAGLGAAVYLMKGKKTRAAQWGLASANLYLAARLGKRSFAGKSVVITGGSRGLGFTLASEFLKEKAQVTLIARDAEELLRAEAQLRFKFTEAKLHKVVCDITSPHQLALAFAEAKSTFGSIDVLINNAGMISVGPFDAMTEDDFKKQMDVNFFAAVNATKLAVSYFKDQAEGQIINICSVGGMVPVPHMSPYDASKFALSGFSQAVGSELERFGITVTTVYPTVMRTGSPGHAFFKGDAEREFLWFETLDHLPGFSISAESAAHQIIEAARAKNRVLVLSSLAKVRVIGFTLFPELVSSVMEIVARFLPRGDSKQLQTGTESRALFDETTWTRPFRESARAAETDHNQLPFESRTTSSVESRN